MKSEKKKILSGKECEVMNYLPYFKEPPIDVIKRYKTIKRYALICHDKDYNEKGILESPHYHIYLDFGRATVPFDMVAKWFGIEPQYVNKVKKTGSLLEYLTHANDSAQFKHQYSPKEVTANFDFVQEAEIEKTFGDFNKYSYARQIKFVHDLPPEKSLKYYNELKKRWELEQAYRSLLPDRDIQVVFIYGKGGTGKTYHAKKMLDDMDYDYCISSSSNDLFQDYKGQWGIILDDIRDRSMSFEDIAAQKNAVGIFSRNLGENFPHEHRQHESGFPVFQLIVASELSQSANGRTFGKGRALNQSFRDGDRQNIRLSGKAHDAHEKLVKAFPVHFVREHRVAHDFTHNVDLVVFFRRVIHKNLRFCFSCMCIE